MPLNRKGLQILYLQPCHVANAGGRASRAKPDPRAATHRPRRLAALVEHGEHGEDFGRSLYPLRGVGGSAPSLSKNIVPRFARLFSVCAKGAGRVCSCSPKTVGCSLFSAPLSSARDSLQAHAFKWWLLAMLGAKRPLCVALVPPAAHLKP